jgi:hypothetical protein
VALLGTAACAAYLSWRANSIWDYPLDAGPPIDDLIHGRWHDFLIARPALGPVSLLLRAPFAALSLITGGGGREDIYNTAYRFGVFPCVMAAGIFGVYLANAMRERGRSIAACALAVALCVVNPVSLRAIHFGHPEEILGAAMVAGAALAALRGRVWAATALLALAIGTKQWAIVALPALALIAGRRRSTGPALALAGVGLAAAIPLLIADAGSLVNATKKLLDLRGTQVFPASIWWPFAPPPHPPPGMHVAVGLRGMPDWLGLVGRPLLLTTSLLLPVLYRRRVAAHLATRALPLLALVLLLRCTLDPADNGYYHVPFFMVLLTADALAGRFAPTIAVAVFLQLPTTLVPSAAGLNAIYLSWAIPFAVYLAGRAYGLDWGALLRSRGARGQDAEPSPPRSAAGARTPTAR